jgi:cytoskeletal protein CcmA (bactofilin family)
MWASLKGKDETMAEKSNGSDLTLIAANTTFEGKIRTEGNIRIDGKFVGEVHAKANAAIGMTGTLEGNLTARSVTVAGKVTGTITASEKLVLEAKSVLQGDIRAVKLVVDEGAIFHGNCDMKSAAGGPSGAAQVPPPKKE